MAMQSKSCTTVSSNMLSHHIVIVGLSFKSCLCSTHFVCSSYFKGEC